MNFALFLASLATLAGSLLLLRRVVRQRRSRYIDSYTFHPGVVNKFRASRPGLVPAQERRVFEALRQYFHLCNDAGRHLVAMPSRVVDDAWHAFILHTRGYEAFCGRAFGRFLHHTPAEAMDGPAHMQAAVRRAWYLACRREGIDPKVPTRLPLLFAIDGELGVADGYRYALDCNGRHDGCFCASHIGCGGGGCSGSTGGDGVGESAGGDGGGCGGGGD